MKTSSAHKPYASNGVIRSTVGSLLFIFFTGAPHTSGSSASQGSDSVQTSSSRSTLVSASQPTLPTGSPSSSAAPGRSTLPDAPSELIVRSSFRHGGAYVMWNPVRWVEPTLHYVLISAHYGPVCAWRANIPQHISRQIMACGQGYPVKII